MIEFEDAPQFMQLTVEQVAQIQAWQRRMAEVQLEERQNTVRWAPMLCRCTPWYDFRYPEAPQHECTVHTAVAFNPFTGGWL